MPPLVSVPGYLPANWLGGQRRSLSGNWMSSETCKTLPGAVLSWLPEVPRDCGAVKPPGQIVPLSWLVVGDYPWSLPCRNSNIVVATTAIQLSIGRSTQVSGFALSTNTLAGPRAQP